MKSYKILIWGCGQEYDKSINMIKYQELLGSIRVVGITGSEAFYARLDGYKMFKISDIKNIVFDYILVASDKYFSGIYKEAVNLGIKEDQILPVRIFQLPGFDFEKYVKLLNSKISIIANNCWGGITYHNLGLQFLSPFINIHIHESEYLHLLKNLHYYINCELKFRRWGYSPRLKKNFPVCVLDDIELFCNHYFSFEDVEKNGMSAAGE